MILMTVSPLPSIHSLDSSAGEIVDDVGRAVWWAGDELDASAVGRGSSPRRLPVSLDHGRLARAPLRKQRFRKRLLQLRKHRFVDAFRSFQYLNLRQRFGKRGFRRSRRLERRRYPIV
ncbi:MAG: hypothetical protein B1H03_04925 [Planctomycetales bacterium 4484_113]|nr:MAG: hypothetical protein B1H03_04925 [Planctomycetales bacterium 4484_113]